MNYYEILGVGVDATKKEIKNAYRKLAQQHHPDKNDNEDSEVFYQIQKAYENLYDDEKREYYDDHGSEKGAAPNYSLAEEKVMELFNEMVMKRCDHSDDLVKIALNALNSKIEDITNLMEGGGAELSRMELLRDRLITINEENLFLNVVDSNIDVIKNKIESMRKEIKLLRDSIVIIELYKDTAEIKEPSFDQLGNWANY